MQLRLKCFEMLCANRDCTSNKMPKHTEICNIFIGGGSVIGIAAGRRIIVCMRSTPLCIRSQRAMVVRRLSVQLPGGQYGLRTDGRTDGRTDVLLQQPAVCDARGQRSDRDGARRAQGQCHCEAVWLGGWLVAQRCQAQLLAAAICCQRRIVRRQSVASELLFRRRRRRCVCFLPSRFRLELHSLRFVVL